MVFRSRSAKRLFKTLDEKKATGGDMISAAILDVYVIAWRFPSRSWSVVFSTQVAGQQLGSTTSYARYSNEALHSNQTIIGVFTSLRFCQRLQKDSLEFIWFLFSSAQHMVIANGHSRRD